MAATTFQLEILTPQKRVFNESVRFVIAPGKEGLFEILPAHAPFVFELVPGVLHIRKPDGSDFYIALGGGFLVVQPATTTILARSAECPEDIDVARAQAAKNRAEQRLRQKTPDVDTVRAQAALQRALARLRVAEKCRSRR